MVESLAQLGGIAVLSDERFAGRLPLFGGIDRARFRRQVVPGEVLDLEVTMGRLSAGDGYGGAENCAIHPCDRDKVAPGVDNCDGATYAHLGGFLFTRCYRPLCRGERHCAG